jgi:hypothetical protein
MRDDIEKLPLAVILRDLAGVKLPPPIRAFVLEQSVSMRRNGSVSLQVAVRLRKLYRDYRSRIELANEARERARVSMALERMGTSRSEYAELVEAEKRKQKAERDDYGF